MKKNAIEFTKKNQAVQIALKDPNNTPHHILISGGTPQVKRAVTNALNNYTDATGYQVVKWSNEGLHGGIEVDHKPHVWQDTIDNTVNNGDLAKMALELEWLKAEEDAEAKEKVDGEPPSA